MHKKNHDEIKYKVKRFLKWATSRPNGIIAAACIVFVLIALFLTLFESNKKQKNKNSQEYAYVNTPQNNASLISIKGIKVNRIGNWVCSEGLVTNISQETLSRVKVVITYYENNGALFNFAEGNVNSGELLLPGKSGSFKQCTGDISNIIDLSKTKVNFEGKVGDDYQNKGL